MSGVGALSRNASRRSRLVKAYESCLSQTMTAVVLASGAS